MTDRTQDDGMTLTDEQVLMLADRLTLGDGTPCPCYLGLDPDGSLAVVIHGLESSPDDMGSVFDVVRELARSVTTLQQEKAALEIAAMNDGQCACRWRVGAAGAFGEQLEECAYHIWIRERAERAEATNRRLELDDEAHRQAQAAVFLALGPGANSDRDTWPGHIRRLREALEAIVKRTADLRWRDEKGRADASFLAFSIAEDALATTPEGEK